MIFYDPVYLLLSTLLSPVHHQPPGHRGRRPRRARRILDFGLISTAWRRLACVSTLRATAPRGVRGARAAFHPSVIGANDPMSCPIHDLGFVQDVVFRGPVVVGFVPYSPAARPRNRDLGNGEHLEFVAAWTDFGIATPTAAPSALPSVTPPTAAL